MIIRTDRTLVLAVGNEKFDHLPFEERNLSVKTVTKDEALPLFATARALVIAERDGDVAKIKGHFESLVPSSEQFGLAIVILVSPNDEVDVTLIKSEATIEKGFGKTVQIYTRERIKEAAEYIARA